MIRIMLAAALMGFFLFVGSCANFKGPPASIYPDKTENPDAYKLGP